VDPIGEALMFFLATDVLEGENGDGRAGIGGRRFRKSFLYV
jgi:hypothetical protein